MYVHIIEQVVFKIPSILGIVVDNLKCFFVLDIKLRADYFANSQSKSKLLTASWNDINVMYMDIFRPVIRNFAISIMH